MLPHSAYSGSAGCANCNSGEGVRDLADMLRKAKVADIGAITQRMRGEDGSEPAFTAVAVAGAEGVNCGISSEPLGVVDETSPARP